MNHMPDGRDVPLPLLLKLIDDYASATLAFGTEPSNPQKSLLANTRRDIDLAIAATLRSAALPKQASSVQLSELDAASNACLEICSRHGFAAGHGDTVADMIREIDAQISARAPKQADPSREELVNRLQWAVDRAGDDWAYRPLIVDAIAALRIAVKPVNDGVREELISIARRRIGAMRIAPCSGIASSRQAAKEFEDALNALSPPSPGERT